jgi:nucleotide-binding universal stress UspA family protein
MNANQANRIVVGFDGSLASEDAIGWAAAEATRRGVPLTLVHAGYYLHEPALSDTTARLAREEFARYERDITERATQLVHKLHPDLEVHTEVAAQAPTRTLLGLAETAAMVVLGTHGDSSVTGAVLGSISQSVAAHAHCPVVVVNRNRPRNAEPRKAIVVGVSPTPGGEQALRFAFEQARTRGCSIEAVRSWGDFSWGTVALSESGQLVHDWQATESGMLEKCLGPIAAQYPDVPVRRKLTGVRAQWALESAAIGAELLVVGCHRPDDHWFSRLGPVASWLLHRSPCPMAVVGRPQVAELVTAQVTGAERAELPLVLW